MAQEKRLLRRIAGVLKVRLPEAKLEALPDPRPPATPDFAGLRSRRSGRT